MNVLYSRTKDVAIRNIILVIAMLLIASCNMKASEDPDDPGQNESSYLMPIGGIESITVDGNEYYFGFSHSDDRVLTMLFTSADEIAGFAAKELSQRDGAHGKAYWLELANASRNDSELADREDQIISLTDLKDALSKINKDPEKHKIIPSLIIPYHLWYLLEANCNWPDDEAPVEIQSAAVRLGLETDDISSWLEESAAILSGRSPLPKGATRQDARVLFEWYWHTLIDNQAFSWNQKLGFK